MIFEDLPTESRFGIPPLLSEHGVVSGIIVTIQGKEKPFGALGVGVTSPRTFTANEVNFLDSVANLLRAAIERQTVEDALRRTEAQLRTAIESLPFDLWVRDKDGRCIMQNSTCQQNWGVNVEKTLEDIPLSREILESWQSKNRRALAGEVVRQDEEHLFGREERFFHTIVAPVHDGDRVLGVLGCNIDITEQKRAEKELRLEREREAALYDLTRTITSSLNLDTVFNDLLRKTDLLPYSAATLRLYDKDSGEFEPTACRNINQKIWRELTGPFSLAKRVFKSRTPAKIINVQSDPRVTFPNHLHELGLVSCLSVPLIAGMRFWES
ncbi:MAG: PAS domain S-box protein [Deltaproteobacteria bacterium]|nr:PAS domain S-box protein [Deltaproteobacteria bacterium]